MELCSHTISKLRVSCVTDVLVQRVDGLLEDILIHVFLNLVCK
jgi:hypothetical protein